MSMMTFNDKNRRSEKLLDAAALLFVRWGFDKTTVGDIAREADVSKGAVYLDFKGKEELFRAVIYRELSRYTEDWLRRFEADPEAWSLAEMVRHSIAAIHANPFIKGLMTRDRRIYGDFLKRDTTLVSMVMSMRTELFAGLQNAGIVRGDVSPKVLAYILTAMGYGLISGVEIVPDENRVPFDDALNAFALLLDSAFSPLGGTADREASRAFFARIVEKMRTSLQSASGQVYEGRRS